ASPTDLNGEALDKLLSDQYGLSPFSILVAKARTVGLQPINVSRCSPGEQLFERVPREFCRQHVLMPVSVIGDLISVAFSNPFALNVSAQIEEMSGLRVIGLLGLGK